MSLRSILVACAGFLALGLPTAAPGQVILSMSPASQTVVPGGSGYVLNFSMTTPIALDLGGFNVTVMVPSGSGITFTGGDASGANYVFAGNSLGLTFNNPSGSGTGDIADFPDSPPSQHLVAGTYDLGRMFFSVASNAPSGDVNVTLNAATSFPRGEAPFDTYPYTPTGGSTIGTIHVSAIPEPSPLLLAGICVASGGMVWLKKRRRA